MERDLYSGQKMTILKIKQLIYLQKKNAIKRGAIHIPVGNGITNKRTRAWACNECKLVLIDCN